MSYLSQKIQETEVLLEERVRQCESALARDLSLFQYHLSQLFDFGVMRLELGKGNLEGEQIYQFKAVNNGIQKFRALYLLLLSKAFVIESKDHNTISSLVVRNGKYIHALNQLLLNFYTQLFPKAPAAKYLSQFMTKLRSEVREGHFEGHFSYYIAALVSSYPKIDEFLLQMLINPIKIVNDQLNTVDENFLISIYLKDKFDFECLFLTENQFVIDESVVTISTEEIRITEKQRYLQNIYPEFERHLQVSHVLKFPDPQPLELSAHSRINKSFINQLYSMVEDCPLKMSNKNNLSSFCQKLSEKGYEEIQENQEQERNQGNDFNAEAPNFLHLNSRIKIQIDLDEKDDQKQGSNDQNDHSLREEEQNNGEKGEKYSLQKSKSEILFKKYEIKKQNDCKNPEMEPNEQIASEKGVVIKFLCKIKTNLKVRMPVEMAKRKQC